MSYCRWSSDDFKSDVYAYEDIAGGFTTHVKSGETFRDGDLGSFLARLESLRDRGLRVPAHTFDLIRAEMLLEENE